MSEKAVKRDNKYQAKAPIYEISQDLIDEIGLNIPMSNKSILPRNHVFIELDKEKGLKINSTIIQPNIAWEEDNFANAIEYI